MSRARRRHADITAVALGVLLAVVILGPIPAAADNWGGPKDSSAACDNSWTERLEEKSFATVANEISAAESSQD